MALDNADHAFVVIGRGVLGAFVFEIRQANRSLPCHTRSLTADFKLRRTSRRYASGHRVDSLPRFKKLAARLVEGPTILRWAASVVEHNTITITAFRIS
jgi:hypothetical protein